MWAEANKFPVGQVRHLTPPSIHDVIASRKDQNKLPQSPTQPTTQQQQGPASHCSPLPLTSETFSSTSYFFFPKLYLHLYLNKSKTPSPPRPKMLPAKRIAPLRSTARLPLSLPLRGAQTPIRQPRRHATTGPQKPGMGIKEEGTAKTYNKDGTNPNKNILCVVPPCLTFKETRNNESKYKS